eukprot:TRINITY_DN29808_c0_g2_i1.p1 TRINITY_DN29808_c0_g2~~TRINITY_DN29808_c0_g2_i1.p1  ORF type:complete len:864 (+),score=226.04 TRINITY_DN29808_c0_g2_i1:92-2593(+)
MPGSPQEEEQRRLMDGEESGEEERSALVGKKQRRRDAAANGSRSSSAAGGAADAELGGLAGTSVQLLGGFLVLAMTLAVAATQAVVLSVVLAICCGSLVFCRWLVLWLLALPTGDDKMRDIASAIREGSTSFFRRVYGTIFSLAVPVAGAIFLLYCMRRPLADLAGLNRTGLAALTAGTFLAGAFCSSLAGYVGLWTSVRANVRVAAFAARSYRGTIQAALRGGAVAALFVVTLVVLGVSLLFALVCEVYVGEDGIAFARVPLLLVGYSFGASFVALFAQLGGGIFTKAADVGADLVGKVEQDIPEDDPRNPAVIADLVGDNVGDCSARGADLFESIAAEIISAMILGGTLSTSCGFDEVATRGYVLFPLVVHAFDIVVSAVGVLSVSGEDADGDDSEAEGGHASAREDPLQVLKGGYKVAMALAFVGFGLSTWFLLSTEKAPDAWWHFFLCGVVGMCTGYASVLVTQYYTDYIYRPVLSIVEASTTGHATNIISGLAVGMESVFAPATIISIAILLAYWLGRTSGLVDESGHAVGGLFGTAVATMGMLSSAVYVLAMDIFGPIADNAGGIVEMSEQPPAVRDVTDRLDAVGNTTKAATKGYAVGSAALACFLLVRAFMDEVAAVAGLPAGDFVTIDIAKPEVFSGGLMGAALVFLFASMAMNAVGSTAQAVVREVRRQFRTIRGIMSGEERPEYGACVDLVSTEALRGMVAPGLLATVLPVAVGLVFRVAGSILGDVMLGAKALCGFMMFTTACGVLMALFLNNAGGAWDNTKKFVETGAHGGKGSETHKAAVTGDTVGDPAKDTAGPSLHVLIKLVSTVALVMCPLFVASP